MQDGLEISIHVVVKMEYNSPNKDAISRYKTLVSQYYKVVKEPVEGNFEDITAPILDDIESDTHEETDDEPALDNTNLLIIA